MYLELGFDKRKFTSDYDINKCTKAEIQKLKENYRLNNYFSKEAVDFYFGKYIAIKADAKNHINYPKSLSELKKLDFQLFFTLEEYVNNWKNLPLVRENAWDDDYSTITSTFCDNLKVWIGNKKFI